MSLKRRLFLATSLALCLAVPAFGAEPYVTAKMLDIATLMQPPPVSGSPADVADLAAVRAAQAQASDARKAQALVDSEETIFVMFSNVMGDKFVTGALPKASV